MEVRYNKHYIVVDDQGRITGAWSDGPSPDMNTADAVCINEQGGYQFRLTPGGEENPLLFTKEGVPLYKLKNGKVLERTTKEIEADLNAIPAPGPTDAQRLEAQVTYTAMMTDTLLEVE